MQMINKDLGYQKGSVIAGILAQQSTASMIASTHFSNEQLRLRPVCNDWGHWAKLNLPVSEELRRK